MSASHVFSVQLQLDWTIKTIAVLMRILVRSLMELSHHVHSGRFQQESHVFWSWPKRTKIFSFSVIVIFIAAALLLM